MAHIYVDADACPVVKQIEIVAKSHNIPVTLFCDTNHVLKSDYSEVKIIGAGADAVDFAPVNSSRAGDIVVTQDYGVAAMALARGAYAINQDGWRYTNENIEGLLAKRHFIKKHSHNQSYRTRNQSGGIRIIDGNIKLPRIGIVKTKLSREFDGRILNATVSRTPAGKYFVSLCVEMDIELLLGRNNGQQIGIDVGIKDFYSNDQGNTVANPRILKQMEKKLKHLQRSLSRKAKGSNNRNKARIKVARLQERIANIRKDFLHKESTKLVRENQLIAVDFYPSSQTCSCCGYQNRAAKNLGIRKWTCPQCNTQHDRDVNAARNILRKALEMQKSA